MCQDGQKKPVPKKPVGKKHRKSGAGQAQLTSPARTLNKLLRTATDKSRTSNETITRECWKVYENLYTPGLKVTYIWLSANNYTQILENTLKYIYISMK